MKATRHHLMIRTLLAAAGMALLVHLAESRDALSDFSRPVVTGVLGCLGMKAHDEGDMVRVGRLAVPWTRDCSGANLLIILLALGVWMNRTEPAGWRFWTRLASIFPAALLANVARVLTLVSYRAIMYPAVENPQLHYFMGLVWLVPFITWLAPNDGRPRSHRALEGLHAAAVVALLTPMAGAPNGELIVIAAVLALMHLRVHRDHMRLRHSLLVLWIMVGVATGIIGVESCWLPWLLVCPALIDITWLRQPSAWLLAASANPMLLVLPGGRWISMASIGWTGWQWWQSQTQTREQRIESLPTPRWALAMSALSLALPFTASTLLALSFEHTAPPADLVVTSLGNEGYELCLPDQSPDIGLLWYGATTTDRHHTVKVCMKYRGADLEHTHEAADVFTDGEQWIRECFLQNHQLHRDYSSYLRATFRPFSSPGTHLIFVARRTSLSATAFDTECQRLAAILTRRCESRIEPLIARQP